jgi:hypothetical protein
VTACHEAGHAVAALMCGGEVKSITIDPTAEYQGHTGVRIRRCHSARVTYAGIWAEARAQWTESTLGDVDDDGCTFDDLVTAAYLRNHEDAADYEHALDAEPWRRVAEELGRKWAQENGFEFVSREESWSRELEAVWPAIQALAARLLSGPMTGAEVTKLVEAHLWR